MPVDGRERRAHVMGAGPVRRGVLRSDADPSASAVHCAASGAHGVRDHRGVKTEKALSHSRTAACARSPCCGASRRIAAMVCAPCTSGPPVQIAAVAAVEQLVLMARQEVAREVLVARQRVEARARRQIAEHVGVVAEVAVRQAAAASTGPFG